MEGAHLMTDGSAPSSSATLGIEGMNEPETNTAHTGTLSTSSKSESGGHTGDEAGPGDERHDRPLAARAEAVVWIFYFVYAREERRVLFYVRHYGGGEGRKEGWDAQVSM